MLLVLTNVKLDIHIVQLKVTAKSVKKNMAYKPKKPPVHLVWFWPLNYDSV